jgi:hypothetical protein
MKIPPVEADTTKLIVTFRNFANAPTKQLKGAPSSNHYTIHCTFDQTS